MNRRTILKGVGGVIGLGVIASALGDDDNSEDNRGNEEGKPDDGGENLKNQAQTETASEQEGDEVSTPQQAAVNVGERVDGERLHMIVRRVQTTDKIGEYQEADDGNEFVVVRLAVKNTSDRFIGFSGFLQTRLKDDEGYNYDQTFAVTGQTLNGGQLAPGEVERGDIVYEVPTDASGLTLQFDFETFDLFKFDRVVVNLERQADSIADLEQTLQVDLQSLGATVAYDEVSVTVNDVRVEEELGRFTEADEGNEYVIVDITTENNTGEEKSISTVLQMLLKDGDGRTYQEDLMATSQLDRAYDEGTPLADGESRRGELAYQIEKGMEPLYWAFEFTLWVDGDKTFWQLR